MSHKTVLTKCLSDKTSKAVLTKRLLTIYLGENLSQTSRREPTYDPFFVPKSVTKGVQTSVGNFFLLFLSTAITKSEQEENISSSCAINFFKYFFEQEK